MGGVEPLRIPVNLCCGLMNTASIMKMVKESANIQLGLDFIMTDDDISVFKFNPKDSLKKLKNACHTEIMGNFLHCVIMEPGIVNVLGRGNWRWKLLMYKMSPEEYSTYTQQISGTRHLIEATKEQKEKIRRLFEDELDPDELHVTLKDMHVVKKDDMMESAPRKQCMHDLIERLYSLKGPDEGYKILLVHFMKHKYNKQYLWKKINAIYRQNKANTNFTGRKEEDENLPGQKLFTADVTLNIPELIDPVKVDIQDPKWHFDTTDADKEDIVILQIKPDWEPAEEEAITTAAPRLSTPESHIANEESHQNISTLDSDRLENSDVDQSVSHQEGNSSNDSNLSHDDLDHAAGTDTDSSLNVQDCIIYQRQQTAGSRSDFTDADKEDSVIGGIKPDWEPTEEESITTEEHGPKRKKIKLTDEETVQLNPHLPKVDNSAGPSTDGEKREINQRQIESPYNSVTSAVKETLNCSDDYLNYIQEELEDALFKGNNDQQQNIPQSLKMVCEQAHKCIRNQEEIVQMVLKLTEDL